MRAFPIRRRRLPAAGLALTLAAAGIAGAALLNPVRAHHGWGSYDASIVLTLDGTVEKITPDNPHAEFLLKTPDKIWQVTLSPPYRMANRGKPVADIKVGDRIVAVGYPSRVTPNEMRAERITHNGVTVELR
jgi:hypothetical protein